MSMFVTQLSASTLKTLPPNVKVPTYDRSTVKAGIVHVGIGGFHRSHQAYYTDLLMEQTGVKDWGICGVALLKYDRKIYDTLVAQNGLYTLMINGVDGTPTANVIGSIVEYMYAPDNQVAVIEKMASRDIKIITLTITEGGYNLNPATGDFQTENPAILKDIANPAQPETIFGYLTQAFKLRRDRELTGVTIQSCDNIQQNGEVTQKMVLAYISLAEPSLVDWVRENVSFPNAMVDRITPVTTATDIASLQQHFQVDDAWPVVCEPFCQWVIEDHFKAGRPQWDLVGAQFVEDVAPYEKMKIRLLNGSHSALAFTGLLRGHSFVFETLNDSLIVRFLQDFMSTEVTPILDAVPGIDLIQYISTLLERFSNPNIKDQLSRIASETSAKAPKFLLATIRDQLDVSERNGVKGKQSVALIKRTTFVLVAWCHYLTIGSVQDVMSDVLVKAAKQSTTKDNTTAFLQIQVLFGDLVHHAEFVALYVWLLEGLRNKGIDAVLNSLDEY